MNQLTKINNKQLLENFSLIVLKEREAICEVISYLSHILDRKLFAEAGYSSLFNFLVEKYLYSKGAAYRRYHTAKLVLREPKVLEYLKEAKLNLTTIALIEPFAKDKKQNELIEASLGKTKEEIQELLAEYSEKVEINKDKIRRLPVRFAENQKCIESKQESSLEEEREKKTEKSLEIFQSFFSPTMETQEPKEIKTQESRRVKIEFVADEKVVQKIERAKALLRHKFPKGKLENIIDEALEAFLEKKDPERKILRHSEREARRIQAESESFAMSQAAQRRMTNKRYIPQQIWREVWKRDNGKCTFQSKEGKKCGETGMLEVDHVRPFALDGKHEMENLRLICASHNKWRAEKTFGIRRF